MPAVPVLVERPANDDAPQPAAKPTGSWLNWVARALLVAACLLCALPWRPHLPPGAVAAVGTTSSAQAAALTALAEFGTAAGYRLALVALIGLTAWRGVPGDRRRLLLAPLRILVAVIIACAALAWRYPPLAGPGLFVPAAVVSLWGFGLGRALEHGLGSLLRWAVLSVLALVAAGAAGLLTLTDVAPAVTDMAAPTAEDRERWQEMLQAQHGEAPSVVELRLTANDLNLLAASWLAAHESPLATDIEIHAPDVQSRLSLPVDVPGLDRRFLNLATQFRPTLSDGQPLPQLTQLQIGPWWVPTSLVQRASATVWALFVAEDDIRRALPAIESLRVEQQTLLVECEPEQAARAATDSLEMAPDATEELRTCVRAAMQRLVETASELPSGDERFLGLLRTAFAIARERSTPETAALENRAVLIALGIQIGDPRVRRLAGFDPNERMPRFRYKFDTQTTLRGRNDLARHYFVSAALRSLSSKEWSFAIGLIKEHLDAADGGSGFSFADLAADLAGVQFAQQATSENTAAVKLQSQLAEPFAVDDLMPSIDGLREGLSQGDFRKEYGSITDPRFSQLTSEIRRRMGDCRLLGVEKSAKPPP